MVGRTAKSGAGCGPATWLRRIALRAHALGFAAMQVRGLDISPKMVALAQRVVAVDEVGDDLCMDARIAVGDLGERLPFPDASFDITLCLYGVLNHMSGAARASLAAELSRVTRDTLFVTVRTAGSLPTIYVDALKRARSYHQDNDADWMEVEMADGRRLAFQSHLFTSRELRAAFAPLLTSVSMVGLDLFRSRFAHDPHWNPVRIAGQEAFDECIASLERRFASDPCLIDHAAHILLVGECGGARPQWPG
jgi:SAM-dependent methyltransferase